jgi:hypothetical protein
MVIVMNTNQVGHISVVDKRMRNLVDYMIFCSSDTVETEAVWGSVLERAGLHGLRYANTGCNLYHTDTVKIKLIG